MVFQYILDALHSLIVRCRDSERMFIMCARHARSARLRNLLQDHADRCARAIDQLQSHVLDYGGDTRFSLGGSVLGKVARGSLRLKGIVQGYDDRMLLHVWEQTLGALLGRYRETLDSHVLPDDLHIVVERQRYSFQHNRDHLHELRAQG